MGDDGPDGWGIKYATEFHMTNDSKLFPPRPQWEAKGYKPDEYSRWLLGKWQPIDELWKKLGAKPLPAGECRCAQPPYDTLPIPRADIPVGLILSRDASEWIDEREIEDIALPLYEGRMIGQFDFSQKGWVSGKGRTAVWREIPCERKQIEPQYLMAKGTKDTRTLEAYLASFEATFGKDAVEEEARQLNQKDYRLSVLLRWRHRIAIMDIGSATNERTMYSTLHIDVPFGHSAPVLHTASHSVTDCAQLTSFWNSFVFDYLLRLRIAGLHLTWNYLEAIPLPRRSIEVATFLGKVGLCLASSFTSAAIEWLRLNSPTNESAWRRNWSLCAAERVRMRVETDAVVMSLYAVSMAEIQVILIDCDLNSEELKRRAGSGSIDPKGFWRVDKEKDPELRHTVLTMVAFHDLQNKITACGGDRDKGIEAFLSQNNGEGWMLPETLRLADYGLGHDDRANEPQPVASRLGPRFYDWQLAQSPEESWRECELHARNLLGEAGYQALLREIEGKPAIESPVVCEPQPKCKTKRALIQPEFL